MIKKTTYKDQVVEYIYKEILKGNLKPKSQIKESHLSETLNISRAPIREALRELINMGIIEYRPRIGNFVVDLQPKDILDTYIARGVIEGFAASVFVFKDFEIDNLYNMCIEMERLAKDNNNLDLIDLGDKFHETIVEKCDNAQIISFARMLSIKSHLMFSKYWPKLYLPNQIKERHILIVDALESKNPNEIEKSIRIHYEETGKKIAKLKEKGR